MGFFMNLAKNVLPYNVVEKLSRCHPNLAALPGGFYSPIPSMKEVQEYNFEAPFPEMLPGIDLNSNEQYELLNSFERYYNELPFTDEKSKGLRYFYKNNFYSYSEAIVLYCMIRYLKPKNIIEVGSGFSSSVMLDTNEKFMAHSVNCVFIDPHPERLESILNNEDKRKVTIHKKRLQEIPITVFTELGKNDILFIDSTHVSKLNSDVNYLIHEILPILAEGVHIHFHDVCYPFEYTRETFLSGKAWNEQYILRAFLECNKSFKIVMFDTYLKKKFENEIKNRFPLLYKNNGGSIWIKRIDG